MQTSFLKEYLASEHSEAAEKNLHSCIHCGMCNATCPTYQVLDNELDGPRGRLYLMKQVFEGEAITRTTQTHLDNCLTCRACESTCPSGVTYSKVLDYGRMIVEEKIERPWTQKLMRRALRAVIPHHQRFDFLVGIGQLFRPLMPASLQKKIPVKKQTIPFAGGEHTRKMLIMEACGQTSTTPNTNMATKRVLDTLGITLVTAPRAGCCGAVSFHLSAEEEAKNFMRANIDAWWPYIEEGIEAIVMTASGCGVHVKDYGHLLQSDPNYADKAAKISALTKDLTEIISEQDLSKLNLPAAADTKVAIQTPCTLQHGQKITSAIDSILLGAGYQLTPVPDAHLCCGSAGTYSILQKETADKLLEKKLNSLYTGQPDIIASANIGCQLHMETKAKIPVVHWIELLDKTSVESH